ncbi:hypothetical protein CBLAS_0718 [Campylobacter blaseri]|uniref:DUF7033 domain-containing protein n=1 Tax=Campylobacter blaseri TaxID=2042961 RepID=A0A2P8R296_9BACT|nr:polysaccharide deacetylase family protein [Campylobacter blaseri]PSM52608.1 hypothetical protein CQ405_02445 [Campylobacter blaseri]PSM54256.1 hypothetical protein CRN67_02445 [Campylobacter blaseri]QKF85908.1 hypothetical protein CBLAS_0718 [Campylobacter blaseri]
MIKIVTPDNNKQERKYILDIIFNEFLGLEYILEYKKDFEFWQIELENGKKIKFKDSFFNKFPNELEYLKLENIPDKVEFVTNKFLAEEDIPMIYGSSDIKVFNDEIVCGIDIFASGFFMLTRWEEYVNKNRDSHDRFPAYESLAYKQGFLDRPVVNEYLEMLKNMMIGLDEELEFKKRKFEFILTHDVDHIYKWDTPKKFIRHLCGDIILRKSFKEFFKSILYYIKVRIKIVNDPYDTFDYLMNVSEKIGTKSYFFFMAEGLTNFDNRYKTDDKIVVELFNKIKSRGHYIGIHPTYNAYNDKSQFKNEKKELEENFGVKISFGREHYLRFELPNTWQIWEDNEMQWDSTLGYADKEGFRCGVCYPYSVFNVLTQKKLNLKEKPLIVMDGSLKEQKNMNSTLMTEKILKLIKKTKKYNGEFVFLWHNSSFNVCEWREYNVSYESAIIEIA